MKKLAFAALLLAACSDPLGSGGVRVRPEQELYAVFGGLDVATVRYTVTNGGDAPVGVPTCGDRLSVQIQRRQNGEWVTLQPPRIACPAVVAFRAIDPGGSATDSVTVQGPGTWRVLVPWTAPRDESGTAGSRGFTTRIPLD